MEILSGNQKIMADWLKELRFYSAEYSDIQLIDVAQKAINFAYNNFKEKETVFEGFDYQYESYIENIALCIDSHLQKNKKNKQSDKIQKFVLDVINTEKYGRGRSGFIYLLYFLKMDENLRRIATERKDFWKTPRIQFQLLYGLYRRKLKGFSKEADMLIENNPKETELKKYAKKYIEQEVKWK